MFLKISQNLQKNTCATVSFLQCCWPQPAALLDRFIRTETLAQVFSCKFCEIFNNTIFTEHLRATVNKQALKQSNSFLLSSSFT